MSNPDTPSKLADVTYTLTDDGLTMVAESKMPDGRILRASTSWGDLATAQANYENAKHALLNMNVSRLSNLETGVRDGVRRLGRIGHTDIGLFTSVGGSPWLLPRLRYKHNDGRLELGAGWLWACFFISFTRHTK